MRRRQSRFHVSVVYRSSRDCWVLRWTDSVTRKRCERQAQAKTEAQAEREAANMERDLQDDGGVEDTTWATFCRRYEEEKLAALRDKTRRLWKTAKNSLETFGKPVFLGDVTSDFLSRFAAKLRKNDLSAASIGAYLRHLRAALRWGAKVFRTYKAPSVDIPRVAEPMKGRPITREEFDRMLEQTAAVVGKKQAKAWKRMLRGLWLSGFRLGESLRVRWAADGRFSIWDVDSERAYVLIPASEEKGNKNRKLPLAPDFVVWLRKFPKASRSGFVFHLRGAAGRQIACLEEASRIISQIGEKARIKVKDRTGTTKYASAHDLRRSFGQRWAVQLMPVELMALMRHSDIHTTMKYYVGRDIDRLSDTLWNRFRSQTGGQTGGIQAAENREDSLENSL